LHPNGDTDLSRIPIETGRQVHGYESTHSHLNVGHREADPIETLQALLSSVVTFLH
jgi:hypothetical protein